jgi:dihydrofolate reductase
MINIIVAIAKNNVIGKNNTLPWHYKEDLQYFKQKTMGKSVLMGSKTFQSIIHSIGKPLPGRKNIVVSKSGFSYPNIDIVDDMIPYLKTFPKEEELFIIGGASIYKQAIPYADRFFITYINREYEGDTFFPKTDLTKYKIISKHTSLDKELTFVVYERMM